MPHLLVVDKDEKPFHSLRTLAAREGYEATSVHTLRDARAQLSRSTVDIVIVDMALPDGKGIDLLDGDGCNAEVIVTTDRPCVDTAVVALRRHALDYLVKPLNPERIRNHLTQVAAKRGGKLMPTVPADADSLGPLVGKSPAMRRLYESICRVARTSAAVLVIGESGTGKELVSQTIHQLSPRAAEPLIAINCGAIPENLIESELFGHEKGAFTGAVNRRRGVFERAEGGTLFLDEISEMPIELQVKLLRVLETGRFLRVGGETELATTARVIAATNRDPADAVPQGKLREDLLYRLSVFPIWVPPLRERGDDIELLARHFLDQLNAQAPVKRAFTPRMIERLRSYSWPGNVRELKNVIWRAFIMSDGQIDGDLMPDPAATPTPARKSDGQGRVCCAVGTSLADAEYRLIMATLKHCGENKKKTAAALGISLKTLYNRLTEYSGKAPTRSPAAVTADESN